MRGCRPMRPEVGHSRRTKYDVACRRGSGCLEDAGGRDGAGRSHAGGVWGKCCGEAAATEPVTTARLLIRPLRARNTPTVVRPPLPARPRAKRARATTAHMPVVLRPLCATLCRPRLMRAERLALAAAKVKDYLSP